MAAMGIPGRATISRHDYRAYIQSSAWRRVRARYWASKLPQTCYVCDAARSPGMHLHHRTYKNLGTERLMDLVPVCPTCHDLIHEAHKTIPAATRNGPWGATKYVRAEVQRQRKRRAHKRS